MGKRGPKPQFIYVACPNEQCSLYGLKGQGNIIGNGTYESRGEKTRKYKCTHCNRVFNDHTGSYFHNLRKDENKILLALQMSMKGMSIEAIAEVLGIQAATVARWIALASEQCDNAFQIKYHFSSRQNLTFRQDNNRVSRKTIGFSKVEKWLEYQMKLYCTHFNFCREHGGLKYEDERGVKCKNTPARRGELLIQSGNCAIFLHLRSSKHQPHNN